MIPDEYKTGNKKIDTAVELQLAKEEHKTMRTLFSKIQLKDAHTKYHVANIIDRTYRDGTVFASKREMLRWDELIKLERAGMIRDLRRQVPFELQESFISRQYGEIKSITYVSDFVYTNISYRKDVGKREVVEDSKGIPSPKYLLKRKMFLYKYGGYLFYEV